MLCHRFPHLRTTLLPWLVSGGAFIYMLWGLDIAVAQQKIQDFSWYPVWGILLLQVVDYALMGIRLACLVPRLTHGTAIKGTIICTGGNNLFPAKAGDALKVLYLHKILNEDIASMLPLVFIERVFDLLLLALVVVIAVFLLGNSLPVWSLAALVGTIFLMLVAIRVWAEYLQQLCARFPIQRVGLFMQSLLHSLNGVRSISLLKAVLFSLLIWIVYFLQFYIALCYMGNFTVDVSQCITVFAVVCLGAALPASPANLGVFEGAMVLALSWYGIQQNDTVAFATIFHMILLLPVTLVALFLFPRCRGKLYKS